MRSLLLVALLTLAPSVAFSLSALEEIESTLTAKSYQHQVKCKTVKEYSEDFLKKYGYSKAADCLELFREAEAERKRLAWCKENLWYSAEERCEVEYQKGHDKAELKCNEYKPVLKRPGYYPGELASYYACMRLEGF